jgi:hypothetical protein
MTPELEAAVATWEELLVISVSEEMQQILT